MPVLTRGYGATRDEGDNLVLAPSYPVTVSAAICLGLWYKVFRTERAYADTTGTLHASRPRVAPTYCPTHALRDVRVLRIEGARDVRVLKRDMPLPGAFWDTLERKIREISMAR
eukprot:3777316-Rhodomonas_salina.2